MGERVWRRWSEWGWGLELVGGMDQVDDHNMTLEFLIDGKNDTSIHIS